MMPESDQFDKLSKELVHVVLTLTGVQDGEAGYSQDPVQQARQYNVLILESVLSALKLLCCKR
jgi:hypothetical protein